MSDRTINISGNMTGVANTGDANVISYHSTNDALATYLSDTLNILQEHFPTISDEAKIECLRQKNNKRLKRKETCSISAKRCFIKCEPGTGWHIIR